MREGSQEERILPLMGEDGGGGGRMARWIESPPPCSSHRGRGVKRSASSPSDGGGWRWGCAQKSASLNTRFPLLGCQSRLELRLDAPREPVAGILSVPRGQSKGAMATFAPITLPPPLPFREGSQQSSRRRSRTQTGSLLPLDGGGWRWGCVQKPACLDTRFALLGMLVEA